MTILGVTMPMEAWYGIIGVVGVFVAMTWWSLRDAFAREFASTNEKMLWIQLVTIIPFLGVLAYVAFGRKRGRKTA